MPNQSLVPIVGKCLLGIVFIAGLSHDNHQIPVKDQASAMRFANQLRNSDACRSSRVGEAKIAAEYQTKCAQSSQAAWELRNLVGVDD